MQPKLKMPPDMFRFVGMCEKNNKMLQYECLLCAVKESKKLLRSAVNSRNNIRRHMKVPR